MTAAAAGAGDVEPRLAAALAATRAAAEETLRWFGRHDLAVEDKADHSPVTAADRAAEAVLRRELLGAFPHDAFLGEETGATPGTSGYEWIVDPIDGTKSFICGVPLYATLVGCRRGDAGVIGVIAIPALDEVVYAAAGGGAWHRRGGSAPVPARVSARRPQDGLVCSSDFTSFGRWAGGATAGVAARERIEAAFRIARTWGDGYGYLLVATGRAEAMVDPLLNRWDAAAVETVVVEAGGRFTDWHGRPGIASSDGVATNGPIHAEVVRLLGGGAG